MLLRACMFFFFFLLQLIFNVEGGCGISDLVSNIYFFFVIELLKILNFVMPVVCSP